MPHGGLAPLAPPPDRLNLGMVSRRDGQKRTPVIECRLVEDRSPLAPLVVQQARVHGMIGAFLAPSLR